MDHGLTVAGPLDRKYFTSIYFNDPDGQVIEIATDGPGWTVDEAPDAIGTIVQIPPAEARVGSRDDAAIAAERWPEPVPIITPSMALMQGMHHISAIGADMKRTAAFYEGVLGMRRLKMTANFDDPNSAHWYWGSGEGRPGTVVTYFERDPKRTRRARMGAGQTHHFALAVADETVQLEWRDRLLRAGYGVSPVRDRQYFSSIYTNDPDGHIIELATVGPGFLMDEDATTLGQALKLPPHYEAQRDMLERALTPLSVPPWPAGEQAR
jgi:glyoxalase family protein